MSEIHINQPFFQEFKKAIKNNDLSRTEFKHIQKTILQDGEVSEDELKFLNALKDGYDTEYEITSPDQESLTFNPQDLDFSKAQAEINGTDQLSGQFKSHWNQAVQDGQLGSRELSSLKNKAQTPGDLIFLQVLEQDSPSTLENPEGLEETWRKVDETWQLDLAAMSDNIKTVSSWGNTKVNTLLRSLNHPNPKVQNLVAKALEVQISQNSEPLNLGFLERMKDVNLDRSNNSMYRHLKGQIHTELTSNFNQWKGDIAEQLQSIEQTSKPTAKVEAYAKLAHKLKNYSRQGIVSPQNPIYKKVTQSIDTALKQDLNQAEISPKEHLEWLQLKHIVAPRDANKDLKNLIFNPDLAEAYDAGNVRQQAMEFLLVNLPSREANQLFNSLLNGEGNPSKEMQESASFYVQDLHRSGLKEYGNMLGNTQEKVRLRGIGGLAELGTPTAVETLLKHYHTRAGFAETEAVLTALNQLKNNPDKQTSRAAYQAKQQLAQASDSQANNAYEIQNLIAQGDQAAVAKIVGTFGDQAMGTTAVKGLVHLLEGVNDNQQAEILTWLEDLHDNTEGSGKEHLTELLEIYDQRHLSLENDLKLLKWLDSPEQQAHLFRELADYHPVEHAKTEQALNQSYENQKGNLSTDQRLDFASARFRLDPLGAEKTLSLLLLKDNTMVSEGAKERALNQIFERADRNPEFSQKLADHVLSSSHPQQALMAAETIQDYGWGQTEQYAKMLKTPHDSVQDIGIQGLKNLALKGAQESLPPLKNFHLLSHRSADKRQIEAALESISQSNSPLASEAQTTLEKLKEAPANQSINNVFTKEESTEFNEKSIQIRKKMNDLHDFDIFSHDRLKSTGLIKQYWDIAHPNTPYLEYPPPSMMEFDTQKMQSVLARDYLKAPENLNDFLHFAPPHSKGKMLKWLQKEKNALSKDQTYQILMSTGNLHDHKAMLAEMRDSKDQPYNLQKLLGDDHYAHYDQRYQSLVKFEDNFHQTTENVMKNDSIEQKGDFVGRALLDFKAGKMSPQETVHAVTHILQSVDTQADFDALLGAMTLTHQLNEDHLVQLLGPDAYDDLSTKIGSQPIQKGYNNEEQAAQEINRFFQFISDPKFSGDGDRVSERLEIEHPEIAHDPVYQKYFNNPSLSDRLMISGLISQGKVDVSGVSGHFVDRALFGKSSMSIFAMHGNINLANFMKGSPKDKAQQFVAMDEFAKRVHNQTQAYLDIRADQLDATAQDKQDLGTTLKAMEQFVAPYQNTNITFGMNSNGITNEYLLEETIKELHPNISSDKAFLTAEKQKIQAFQKYLSHYGKDPDQAAKKMEQEAKNTREMKGKLGVEGSYENKRSHFMRYQAFPLYYDKDMDILHGLYEDIVADMSKHGMPIKQVLDASSDLEGEFKLVKDVGSTVLGLATGTSVFIEGAKWTTRLTEHYGVNDRHVDGGVRSQAIQDQNLDGIVKDVVWDTITMGVGKGFSSYKKQAEEMIKIESELLFGVAAKTEARIAGGLATQAEKDLLEASQVFTKNALTKVEQKIKPLQIGFETFKSAVKDEDYTKALSSGFVEAMFNHALGKQSATDHRKYTAAIADKLISPTTTALDNTLELLDGEEKVKPTRNPGMLLEGSDKKRAEAFFKYALEKYPDLKSVISQDIKTFADFEKLVYQYSLKHAAE